MHLNHSITALFQFTGAGNAILPKEGPKEGHKAEGPREHGGFRKIAVQEQRSHMRHLDQLTKRLGEMSNMLMRLQQSSPELKSASAVMLERAGGANSQFAYSFSQSESGVVTQSFSFSIQFKPQGESNYIKADAAPTPTAPAATADPVVASPVAASAPVIAGPEQKPVSTSPVIDPAPIASTGAPVIADGASKETAAPVSFDERVAQLISYYSISISVSAAGGVAAPVQGEKAAAETVAADDNKAGEDAKAPAEAEKREHNLINIDAGRVRRVRTGGGDDNLFINADRARRIRTGGGDDNLLINAGRVSRVNSGSGDDFIDVTGDRVSRIRSGGGDDVVNIDADRVRRVSTGSGDDNLIINADRASRIYTGAGDDAVSINADTIKGVHTGAGDDTLNLTADRIGYINAGAGNDTITLDAKDAAIYFGQGGGDDVIDIKSVGALAVHVDDRLALSGDDITISRDGVTVTLEFASGERLTLANVENADLVSLRVGGETIDLHLSQPTIELDMSA